MITETVTFAQAKVTDLHGIWHLLLADSKMLPPEKIYEIREDLYILRYNTRILGVLYGTYVRGQVNIMWVVVHPLFPENSLCEAMVQEFCGAFCREPKKQEKHAGFKRLASSQAPDTCLSTTYLD